MNSNTRVSITNLFNSPTVYQLVYCTTDHHESRIPGCRLCGNDVSFGEVLHDPYCVRDMLICFF